MAEVRMIGYTWRSKANRGKPDDRRTGSRRSAAIVSEADRREWTMIWTDPYDGWTGANTRRPGLTTALDMLSRGEADGLVIAKLDRLSSSVAGLHRLLRVATKQKWSVVALDLGIDTLTINGRLVANIVMSVGAPAEGAAVGMPAPVPNSLVTSSGHLRRPRVSIATSPGQSGERNCRVALRQARVTLLVSHTERTTGPHQS